MSDRYSGAEGPVQNADGDWVWGRLDDEVVGEIMPAETYEALRHVPLAAVRRAFQTYATNTSGPTECDHRNAQLYRRREWHYCPDCKRLVER